MSQTQSEMWDTLCEMSGEDVARAFTNYYGNQLLSEDFRQFMIDEGYMEDDTEENNE